MKTIFGIIAGILIGSLCTFAFFTYNINHESTELINSDIEKYNKSITELDKEIAKYSGGLLLSMLQLQKAIYMNNISALEAKKTQLAHWIVFNYDIKDAATLPLGELDAYNDEIKELRIKIANDEKESAKYSPCLIKSLIDSRIAQQQLTLSGLERAVIAKKYNLPFLIAPGEVKVKDDNKPKQPVDPVKDKESL